MNRTRIPPHVDDEPDSFTAADVAKFLEEHGRPRFASCVAAMASRLSEAAQRYASLANKYNAMVMKYEPPRPGAGATWTGD